MCIDTACHENKSETKMRAAYAELQATSNFSFLTGGSHPHELVAQARALGLTALAITDRNTLAGVVRAHVAAKEVGLKLIVGARLDLEDAPSLICLPTNRAAYGRLSRLISLGQRRAEKGKCILYLEDVAGHAEGQVLIVLPPEDWDWREVGGGASQTGKRGVALVPRLEAAASSLFPVPRHASHHHRHRHWRRRRRKILPGISIVSRPRWRRKLSTWRPRTPIVATTVPASRLLPCWPTAAARRSSPPATSCTTPAIVVR